MTRDDIKAALQKMRQVEIQAIGAAISTRDWWANERAYNALRDGMDRLLQKLVEPAGQDGWQPIATAPKDHGFEALIYGGTLTYDGRDYGHIDFNGLAVASYSTSEKAWYGGEGYGGDTWHHPTHWRPLPALPDTGDQ